jgi:hypothetical protein
VNVQTHHGIDRRLCGEPTMIAVDRAVVALTATAEMAADDRGLVHGGFVFGAADYAAMLAVNHPNVVLDAKGGIHVLYYNRLQAKLMYARKLGAKWELAPARLDGQEGFYAATEVDAQGVVHVAIDTGDTLHYGRGASE